jgi:hypothetical protein
MCYQVLILNVEIINAQIGNVQAVKKYYECISWRKPNSGQLFWISKAQGVRSKLM